MDDSLLSQFSAGISVLNTLRGQVPNTGIGPAAQFATARANLLYVIDGLPSYSGITDYYNMNSFDYASIAFLSRGNAASLYGGAGSNGAFVLKSKTGENQTRPTIEFNSYSTYAWDDPGARPITQWYFSNYASLRKNRHEGFI